MQKGDERAERRAFAGAVRPQQAEDFTGIDMKRQVLDGLMTVVALGKVTDIDGNRAVQYSQPFAP